MRIQGERLAPWVGILQAKNPTERYAAVSRLSVTIVESIPGDGRRGVLKTYIAGGKARLQRFIPVAQEAASSENSDEPQGGPRATTVNTGRWKLDGDGGCYWDDVEDGPDQCSPVAATTHGRWKLDGNGGCYWLDNDDGPDQCDPYEGRWKSDGNGGCYWDGTEEGVDQCSPSTPPSGVCYYQGEQDTCVTQQALDDLSAQAAAAEADIELMEDQFNASYALYEEYCNENPWDCEEDEASFYVWPKCLSRARLRCAGRKDDH
jgi:hypothetical protein